MGMGGTGGLGTDWERLRTGPVQIKTGADAWKSMRSRINKVRNDEEVKGESAFLRFVVVGLMVVVAWAGASMASAQEVDDEPDEPDEPEGRGGLGEDRERARGERQSVWPSEDVD